MPQEPPEPQGPLQAALRDSTLAATTRASEGQALFSPIAVFLDKHRREVSDLNPHLRRALASLSDDLASVAQRHFDAFICGVPPSTNRSVRYATRSQAHVTLGEEL